ncbi:MAG TPA: hypothetical protein VFP49_13250 [Nitrososphaeraceae archaeon]|jgi:hypothetical protein|nr:hypothetical protein [Nitrososphaeraceae archaeon]
MLSVSCRGVGVDCDFLGSGGIKEGELLNCLVDYAIKDRYYTLEYVIILECRKR